VSVDHQQERVIPDAVPPFLGGVEQLIDLWTAQKILASLVSISG